jgi:hypothetical protein
MLRRLLLIFLVVLAARPANAAGRYLAYRYDSRIEVQRGGTLRVTETITVRFETGSFSQFYRAIPTRMTDGIEIVSALMDGTSLSQGSDVGHFEISGSSNVRVTWRFAVTAPATHTFEVTYLAKGIARQEDEADVINWNLLPTEHSYSVAASATDITLPEAPSAMPTVDTHRVGESTVERDGVHVRIEGDGVRANGWLQVRIRLPRESVINAPPLWQQRQREAKRLSIQWVYAAAIVVVSGFALLFFVRQRYDSPPREPRTTSPSTAPPDALPPPIAGALLANGSPRLEQAMAGLFVLADRGELRIEEQSRAFGLRDFTIVAMPTGRPIASYEERLLEIIFTGAHDGGRSVTLGKARNRLIRQLGKFRAALEPAMVSAGLLDDDRRSVRKQFVMIAIVCLIAAGVFSIGFAFIAERFGGWPMLIPLALAIVGVAGLIAYGAHTPLSNDGVRRANEWRGFRRYLRDVARDRQPSPGDAAVRQLLPFAVAFGIAGVWSAYLKRHRAAAPAWFRSTDTGHYNPAAFSAFVASGGSGAGGHGHGGAAAAGGGSSGAS